MPEIIIDLRKGIVCYKLKTVNLVGNCSAVNEDAGKKFPGFRAIRIHTDYRHEEEVAKLRGANLNLSIAQGLENALRTAGIPDRSKDHVVWNELTKLFEYEHNIYVAWSVNNFWEIDYHPEMHEGIIKF